MIRRMLRGLRCDLPTWMLRVRQANSFVDFTGKYQDIAGMFPGIRASHCAGIHRCCVRCFPATARTLSGSCPDDSSDATRRLPGRCWDTARMNPGNCPAFAAAFPPDNRRIAGGQSAAITALIW